VLLRIDPAAAAPIFEQVVQRVKELVAAGQLAAGDRLPSVRELARELAINPNTVARAYERLEAEDVIVRRQGAGCFVTARRPALAARERRARVAAAMRRLVTDAFHMGASADEISAALAAELERLHFPDPRGR
jgi:GntR family transcriptional regulator